MLGKLLVTQLLIFTINNNPVIGKTLAQLLQGVVLFLVAPVEAIHFVPAHFARVHLVQAFLQGFPGQVKPDLDHIDLVVF